MRTKVQNKMKNFPVDCTCQDVRFVHGFAGIKYFLIFLILLLANIYFLNRLSLLKEYANLIFVCYPVGSVTELPFEQFKENEGSKNFSKIALWKSVEEVTVSAENTGRERKASFYQVKGQPEAVFGNNLVHGRYFTEEENRVCLLDQSMAQQLFGSENVLGMEVRIGEKSYQITGLLKGDNRLCAVPAEENTGFDGMAVQKQEKEQSSALAVSLIEAVFGSTDGQKVDGQLYFMTARLFYSVVSAMMLVILGAAVTRKRKILCRILCAVCMAAAVWVLISGIKSAAPGADYLPTYWSDFDFFVRLFQEKAGQIQRLAAYQEFPVWQEMLQAWRQVIAGVIFEGMVFGIFSYAFPALISPSTNSAHDPGATSGALYNPASQRLQPDKKPESGSSPSDAPTHGSQYNPELPPGQKSASS